MTHQIDTLRRVGDDLEVAVRRHGTNENATLVAVELLLHDALTNGLELPAELTEPHPDHYVMYPVHGPRDVTVCCSTNDDIGAQPRRVFDPDTGAVTAFISHWTEVGIG